MSTKNLRRYLEQRDANKEVKSEDEELSGSSDGDGELRLRNKFLYLSNLEAGSEKDSESFAGNTIEEEDANSEQEKCKNKDKKKLKARNRNKKCRKKNDKVLVEPDNETLLSSEKPLGATQSSSKQLFFERDIFKINMKMLDGEVEFRKILGLKAGSQSHHRRNLCGRIVHKRNTWPPVTNLGLSMEKVNEENGVIWFNFIHHPSYKVIQEVFWSYAKTVDHQGIQQILFDHPYHLDSLLVMAEVMRQQEDYQVSRDLIERGIFCCESVFCSQFELNNFDHRISYNQLENRAFFLLLHQHMRDMLDRCCFVTALNLAKLIYLLNPVDDPLGILLSIDVLALRAKEYHYFFQLYNTLKEPRCLDRLPNFAYSVALAHFLTYLETNDVTELKEAGNSLATAIYHFPTLIMQLLSKLNIQPNDDIEKNVYMNALAHERESEGSKHLIKVYVSLSECLWKDPETLSWLETATLEAVSHFSENKDELEEWRKIRKIYVGLPRNVERHGFLWNVIQNAEWTLFDPAPPYSSTSTYSNVESSRPQSSQSALLRLFTSLVVDERQAFHLNSAIEQAADGLLQLFNGRRRNNAADGQQPHAADDPPPEQQ